MFISFHPPNLVNPSPQASHCHFMKIRKDISFFEIQDFSIKVRMKHIFPIYCNVLFHISEADCSCFSQLVIQIYRVPVTIITISAVINVTACAFRFHTFLLLLLLAISSVIALFPTHQFVLIFLSVTWTNQSDNSNVKTVPLSPSYDLLLFGNLQISSDV